MRRPSGPAYVYRCFDADGVLIYIGSSENPERRIHVDHKTQSWWYDQLHRFTVEEHPGGCWDAEAAEKAAIAAESPRWNIQGKPRTTAQEVADLITSLEHSRNTRLAYNREWIARLRRDLEVLERTERGACPHCGQAMPAEESAA